MGWEELAMLGWEVFPLPFMRKGPPPKGATGESGENLGEKAWENSSEDAGVGIRLPRNVIGLDFDLYRGQGVLTTLESRLGPLPYSRGISNRESPFSEGVTVLFQVPEGIHWRGGWRNLDIIHWALRYCVAPPSIHPSGRAYRWVWTPSGLPAPAPAPEELPMLPTPWVNFLKSPDTKGGSLIPQEQGFSLSERDSAQLCGKMRSAMGRALRDLRAGSPGSRHDAGVRISWNLTQLRASGHSGYDTARRAVIANFAKLVEDARGEALAAEEARALFSSAEQKVPVRSNQCSCGKKRSEGFKRGGVSRRLFT